MFTGNLIKIMLGVSLTALLSACANVQVSQEVEMPAQESGMVSAKKLAVFNLDGDSDGTFSTRVESYLASIRVRGTPYFELLERKRLEKIISEQKMVSSSGMFNERDAVKLGSLAGADTLVMGAVNMPKPAVRNYQKPEQVCSIKATSKDGKSECVYWTTRYLSCTSINANIDFTLKAVSVQKGNITFSKTYSGSASDDHCEDGQGKSAGDLQNEVIHQVFSKLRNDVAPYTVTLSIELMEEDDFMSSETEDKVESAIEFAKQKRMDRACGIFKEALASDTNSPALYYNLGVCAELGADLDRAELLYKQADQKVSKPDALISKAINRIQQKKALQLTISKQVR